MKIMLKECGLTTLETRRLRVDQIEVSKILNGYENIDRNICSRVRKRGLEDTELQYEITSVDYKLETLPVLLKLHKQCG